MTTILSQIYSPIQRIEPALQRIFSDTQLLEKGPRIENTNVLHSSPPVKFFKLFITDDFVTKMAEQTNFYAVQRGVPFKPVSHGVIN